MLKDTSHINEEGYFFDIANELQLFIEEVAKSGVLPYDDSRTITSCQIPHKEHYKPATHQCLLNSNSPCIFNLTAWNELD